MAEVIFVEDLTASVLGVYNAYIPRLEAAFIAAVVDATNRIGLNTSPEADFAEIMRESAQELRELTRDVIASVSTEASERATADESLAIVEDEADRVEKLSEEYDLHLFSVIESQMLNDARTALKSYQSMWLQVELNMGVTAMNLVDVVRIERDKVLGEFKKTDAEGKQWLSSRYVQVETMNAITTLYNDVFIYLAGNRDHRTFRVVNPGNRNDGKEFSIDEYDDVKPEYFHHNSPAMVGKTLSSANGA